MGVGTEFGAMGSKLPPVWSALLLLLALSCGGEAGTSGIAVDDAWARPMVVELGAEGALPGTNSAAYLDIRNGGRNPDRLLGAESPVAERTELHESVMDGDVMRMRRVDGVDLPPGETLRLAPGGLHVMLLDLRRSLEAGDTLTLTLTFRDAPPLSVAVPVRSGA